MNINKIIKAIVYIVLINVSAAYSQNLIEDLNPGTDGSNPRNFYELSNETVYFWSEINGEYRLFKSTDRTPNGTNMLSNPAGSYLGILLEGANRMYYLSRSSGSSIYNLCYVSKTNDSVHNCSVIGNSSLNFDFYQLFEFQNAIYLTANYQNEFGLFRYNETIEDFELVVNGHGFRWPGKVINGELYYGWTDSLYSFDGQNSTVIKGGIDVNNGFFINTAQQAQINGIEYLYFLSDLRDKAWRSDGTTNGTVELQTPFSSGNFSINSSDPVINSSGFYAVWNVQEGADFTTYLMSNSGSPLLDTAIRLETGISSSNSEIRLLRATQDKLYWRKEFDVVASDGTQGNTQVIGTFGSGNITKPTSFMPINNTLFFAAVDVNKGYELVATSGTAASTFVYDINPGPGSSMLDLNASIRISNNRVYLATTNGTTGVEPYFLSSIPTNLEESNNDYWNVYPNPAKADIFLDTKEAIDLIELYDLTGRKIDFSYNESEKRLTPLSIIKGLFILKIHSQSGVTSKKIIWE